MSDAAPPPNAAIPIHPRQRMAPGWYWKLLEAEEAGALWTAFTRANPAIKTRKTKATGEGDAAAKGSWVLFEVTGDEPVIWTLPGLPSQAPGGAATEYEDLIQLPPPDESTTDALDKLFGGLRLHLGAAATVLIWGGAGVALWRLIQLGGKRKA